MKFVVKSKFYLDLITLLITSYTQIRIDLKAFLIHIYTVNIVLSCPDTTPNTQHKNNLI